MNNLKQDYSLHWDEKFRSRAWGRYPPEEFVRFMGRKFGAVDRSQVSVLEVGCGPGANLWFLHREGFRVAGIDGSPAAVELAATRLATENAQSNAEAPDLKIGDFSILPWQDESFDVVADIFAVYANPLNVIHKAISEIYRVLKPGGVLFAKLWGRGCTGYGQGVELEKGTWDEIPAGPCADMGVAHFFDEAEIREVYTRFDNIIIDSIHRTDNEKNSVIEEFVCQFRKN